MNEARITEYKTDRRWIFGGKDQGYGMGGEGDMFIHIPKNRPSD